MNGRAALPMTGAAAALLFAWLASPELPPPARAWSCFLLVALPALMIRQAALLADVENLSRSAMYASTAVFLWILAAATYGITHISHIDPAAIGLRAITSNTMLGWTLITACAGIGVMAGADAAGIRESALLRHLLPRSRNERVAFTGVAATAGICEELIFRGFLFSALTYATGSVIAAVVLAALAFGLVHAYQDVQGVTRAAAVGVLLTVPVIVTGSIYPSAAAHFVIDIVGGLWLGPRRLSGIAIALAPIMRDRKERA